LSFGRPAVNLRLSMVSALGQPLAKGGLVGGPRLDSSQNNWAFWVRPAAMARSMTGGIAAAPMAGSAGCVDRPLDLVRLLPEFDHRLWLARLQQRGGQNAGSRSHESSR